MTTKVALVVGGGSGIGAGAATALAAAGYDVGVMSSSGKGEALGTSLGGLGFTGSNLIPADLAAFVDLAMERWGRIDGVVNCAGHGPKGDLLSIDDQSWHLAFDTYFLNVVRVSRLVTPIMERLAGGSIVNISSFAAVQPDLDFPTSAVARAPLADFTKLFSTRYAAQGIRMNNVLPGFVDSLPPTSERLAQIPAARYARVDEVAGVIVFLVSDASTYVTGQNIVVDGGLVKSV